MKKYFSIKTVIALVLTFIIVYLIPAQTAFAAENGKYVSEVYVAYAKDYDSAKRILREKGYEPVDGNLNDGGKTYALMGYKTTNNIRDAITDLAVMNMNGDFSAENYKTLLKKQKSDIAGLLKEFMAVIREYRVNLKAGKTKAVCAHDLLNNYIDDDTGMKMGDLLNSETLQDKLGVEKSIDAANPDKLPDLVTIFLQGNVQVIKSIEILLSLAADTADNSWIDRFALLDFDEMLDSVEDERPELNTAAKQRQYLDTQYASCANQLGAEAVQLRQRLLDYENAPIHIDTASEEDIKKYFENNNAEFKTMLNEQDWIGIGSVYESLKNYEGGRFAKGELLSFFLDENDPEDTEIFIPMAAALSEGQRAGMLFVDFEALLRYAFSNEESWKKTFENYGSCFGGLDDVSVYQNIDRDIYKEDGTVALTGAAQRAMNTAAGTTGSETEQTNTLQQITAISYGATMISALICGFYTYQRYRAVKAAAYDYAFEKWESVDLNKIYDKQAFMDYKEYVNRLNAKGNDKLSYHVNDIQIAREMVFISRVLIITTLAFALISAVLTVIDMLRDEGTEQLPIPKYMVDSFTDEEGGSYQLNYKAVACNREEYFGKDYTVQKGSCADLLCDEGYQWLALYASKNSKAGKPIEPSFSVSKSKDAPDGLTGTLHIIGEKGALNIAGNVFKKYSTMDYLYDLATRTLYVHYKQSKDNKTYDESAGNMTASAIRNGNATLFGFGGLAVGALLGVVGTLLVKRKKESPAAA